MLDWTSPLHIDRHLTSPTPTSLQISFIKPFDFWFFGLYEEDANQTEKAPVTGTEPGPFQ